MNFLINFCLSGVFSDRTFQKYWLARFLTLVSLETISVCVAWQIYDITRDPLYLGLVGLTQFLPLILLVVITGYVSDNYNRKRIFAFCLSIESIIAMSFIYINSMNEIEVKILFIPLIGLGIVRAFVGPAASSLLPNIVKTKDLPDAVALSAVAWQMGTIFGPITGGILYGISSFSAYLFSSFTFIIASILVILIPHRHKINNSKPKLIENLAGGFLYVWKKKILLGVISLDLFAVLMAGAVALLPVYARDILDTGPITLGLLRSSPGIGAIIVAIGLSRYSLKNSGLVMLLAVSLFGLSTLLFGVSTNTKISIVLLCFIGGFDMLSVYIRDIIIQLGTEDRMRGRVNAINMMFVGASNELGEFRAGIMASSYGTVPAVVIGGIGAIFVSGVWGFIFPSLLRVNKLKVNLEN